MAVVGNANDIVVEMAREVLPVVSTPPCWPERFFSTAPTRLLPAAF